MRENNRLSRSGTSIIINSPVDADARQATRNSASLATAETKLAPFLTIIPLSRRDKLWGDCSIGLTADPSRFSPETRGVG